MVEQVYKRGKMSRIILIRANWNIERKSKLLIKRPNKYNKKMQKPYNGREKNLVICLIESPLKMMKNVFCFILKALFILEIFKFLSRLFGHVGKTAW